MALVKRTNPAKNIFFFHAGRINRHQSGHRTLPFGNDHFLSSRHLL